MKTLILPFLCVACFSVGPRFAVAQTERWSARSGRTLEVIDHLKEIIQRWEKNRTANPVLLNQLRDLVRRYDWPWRVKLLFDDFKDGDYNRNPAWVVSRGEFSIARPTGLRTRVEPRSAAQQFPAEKTRDLNPAGTLGGIVKDLSEPAGIINPLADIPRGAEISTPVAIGNAFAIRARMLSQAKPVTGARIEFGPYRGNGREWGYRIAYNPGQRPSFEILRFSPGRSAVVETYDVFAELEDGKTHELEWRRDRDGAMSVFVDGTEIVQAVDRGITEFFDGFTIVNLGGDYTFEEIEIFGAEG